MAIVVATCSISFYAYFYDKNVRQRLFEWCNPGSFTISISNMFRARSTPSFFPFWKLPAPYLHPPKASLIKSMHFMFHKYTPRAYFKSFSQLAAHMVSEKLSLSRLTYIQLYI